MNVAEYHYLLKTMSILMRNYDFHTIRSIIAPSKCLIVNDQSLIVNDR